MKGRYNPNLLFRHSSKWHIPFPSFHIIAIAKNWTLTVFLLLVINKRAEFYSIFDTFALNLQSSILFMSIELNMFVDLIHIALKLREVLFNWLLSCVPHCLMRIGFKILYKSCLMVFEWINHVIQWKIFIHVIEVKLIRLCSWVRLFALFF